jgi:tetratricopeptide (TPR) repeat protein
MVEKGLAVCQSHGFVLRNSVGGIEVSRILDHGPADLQKEDVLVSVDGTSVGNAEEAFHALEGSIGVSNETVLEVSRGAGRVQEIVTVTMPCPSVKAEGSTIVAAAPPKPFSFHREKKEEKKDDVPSSSAPAPGITEVPPSPEASEAEKEKELGSQAFKDSCWEDAINHFTAAIDLSPKPVPNTYYSNRAAAYLQVGGRAKEALMDAVKSTDGYPDFAKGHYRAGQALLELERHNEAVAALNRARMCDPNNVQIYGALSRAQALLAAAREAKEEKKEEQKQNKQKKTASGVKQAQEAFASAKTNDINERIGLSDSSSKRNAPPPARTAPNSDPDPENPMRGWGQKFDEKKREKKKAASMWGDDSGVLGGAGASEEAETAKEEGNKAFGKGDFALAAEHFTLAINLDPNNHVYYANRSAALLKMGKLEDSLEDADQCVKMNRMYAKGHFRKGQALAVIGRVDLAVASMEEAVKLDPNNESLQEALAGTKRLKAGIRGEGEEVETWCSDVALGQIECEVPRQGKAGDHVTMTINVPEYGPIKIDAVIPPGLKHGDKFKVDVGSPLDISKTKKEEGIRAYRGGRLQKAVTDFSDSLHLNPQDAGCYANRSAANYSLGKLEEALSDADKCISILPSLHKGFLRKGLALAALCDFHAAVEALKRAQELCAEDEAVAAALKEAEADLERQEKGEKVSRFVKEEDARKTSKYVTLRTAVELEEKMDEQYQKTQMKQRDIAARSVEKAVEITNEMLWEEIRVAKAEDTHKADTERAKFQVGFF